MKNIFIIVFLLVVGFAKAQIVNIPDSNFKYLLVNSYSINTNHDGEIQESEALSIISLSISPVDDNRPIRNLSGIRSFLNLKNLDLFNCTLTDLDVSGLTALENLKILIDSLSSINLTGCANLNFFKCNRTSLADIDINGLTALQHFDCEDNLIRKLEITDCPNLSEINCGMNPVTKISCIGLHKLKSINSLIASAADTLNFNGCDSLTGLVFNESNVSQLNINGCKNLSFVTIGSFKGTELDISSCPNISIFAWFPALQWTNLTHLNIKNGSPTAVWFNPNFLAPNLKYICADEFEITSWLNGLVNAGNTDFTINSFCSFTPGGSYNTISGNTKLDLNNSGCDSTGRNLKNTLIRLTDTTGQNFVTSSNEEGKYKAFTYKGIFTLRPYFPYPYFTINPSSANVTFDTANGLLNTTNFCIRPNGIHNDLEITFLPVWPSARPGFDAGYILVYKNRGTTTLNGNVTVNFDNSKMNYLSASENTTAQSTGQLTWSYNNLQPFESKNIYVTFNLLPPPVNNIGDTITYLAAITPWANDETAFDNNFILPQRVIGSFDPNDKQCLEGSKLDISKIGDYLHYIIHFQNEGTDTAFNIVVADTLNDKLDWNSFELIGSSHPCSPTLKNNKAEFVFENIHLPYKAINEPASNGWVAFKIKSKPTVVIGDSLNNKAAIYFDFSLPVITNTATTIVSSSSTPVPVRLEYFSVNTRNNTNTLNWKAACTYGNANFIIERSDDGIHFSSIGNMTATLVRCQLPFNFADNNPVAGKNYYRLKITDAHGISFYSKVLVVGNNKAGVIITAVAGNIIYLNSKKQQTIQIKVIAADGKSVYADNRTITAGNNQLNVLSKKIASGIYTLVIYTNDGARITKRFLK